MEMFDANRISTAETDKEYAAYFSSDSISNYLQTILLSMVESNKVQVDLTAIWQYQRSTRYLCCESVSKRLENGTETYNLVRN